jgi:hypothetical protein
VSPDRWTLAVLVLSNLILVVRSIALARRVHILEARDHAAASLLKEVLSK